MPLGERAHRIIDPKMIQAPLGSGFREALDLSDVVDKYEVFNPDLARKRAEERKDRQSTWKRPGEGEEPERAGSGPIRCSTARQVASSRPQWAWDPNRYYRDLGIAWPYVGATKKDLRMAFYALDGHASDRLTYCLKQLLTVRAEYDAMPLGEQYLNDIYVQDEMKRKASLEATERTRGGTHTTGQDVLDEWGYKVVQPEDETPPSILDEDHSKRLTEPSHEQSVGTHWHYAFYLWKTTDPDTNRLAAWQAALVSEADQEIIPTITVGLMGKQPHEYAIGQVDNEWVVFLNRDAEVSPDLARRALTALKIDTMRPARRA